MSKMTICLPEEHKLQLENEAETQDINLSILMRKLIREHIDKLLSEEEEE